MVREIDMDRELDMDPKLRQQIDRLKDDACLPTDELRQLLAVCDQPAVRTYLAEQARTVQKMIFGQTVYMRGLIEFTNYCQNDCHYCGIRKSNRNVSRYRLTDDEILDCCAAGHRKGFRTFVLQGGEDPFYTDERLLRLIKQIKQNWPDCALTLSVGEKPFSSYAAYRRAGADRYLLRHETADPGHYSALHPANLTAAKRQRCLADLKRLGYQTGCGFMVGSPGQTREHLLSDLLFMKRFQPEMAGIGPFLPHHDTPYKNQPAGSFELTLALISILRLLLPNLLLSATTALGTIHPEGREQGILAGANVVMPNLSPEPVRDQYCLYDNKLNSGAESGEGLSDLAGRLDGIGYKLVVARGDYMDHRSTAFCNPAGQPLTGKSGEHMPA